MFGVPIIVLFIKKYIFYFLIKLLKNRWRVFIKKKARLYFYFLIVHLYVVAGILFYLNETILFQGRTNERHCGVDDCILFVSTCAERSMDVVHYNHRLSSEPELRHVMRVQLVNAVGLDEAGIDGGGLFREFLSELLKTAFDPKLGFFRLTEDNLLYPNPGVALIHPDFLKHYYFIGRMLGKVRLYYMIYYPRWGQACQVLYGALVYLNRQNFMVASGI